MIEFATIYVLTIMALIGMYLYLEEYEDFHILTQCLVLVPFFNTFILFVAIFVISSIKLMEYVSIKFKGEIK